MNISVLGCGRWGRKGSSNLRKLQEEGGNIMILNDLQRNMPVYDEITLVHRVVEVDDLIIEILGFIRCDDELKLYILEHDTRRDENQEKVKRRPREPKTNRENVGRLREHWKDRKRSMGISQVEIDGELFKVLSASMTSLGERDMQSIMLVNEFIRQGAVLSEMMGTRDLEHVYITTLEIEGVYSKCLGTKDIEKVKISFSDEHREYKVRKRLNLEIGKSYPKTFKCGKGEDGFEFYINKVYLMDLEAEFNTLLKEVKERNILTDEEIMKFVDENEKYQNKICPEGSLLPVIEYEVSLENLQLQMDTKAYLDASYKSSSSFMGMIIKSDEPYGTHGLRLKVVAMSMGVPKDTTHLEVEIYGYGANLKIDSIEL